MAIDPARGVDETLARISADPRVRLAQPMQAFNVHGGYDDPYFSQQYGANAAQLLQMHQRATGRGIRVAVIDTGADRTHPDLQGRIDTARNFVGDDARFDSDIHGTAVAGIIAANANNGIGIVGLAPDADLLVLKACWQRALDDIRAQCNTFTLAKALTFAIDQHADIINMSLGGPNDPLLALLIEVALARGIVVVAAQDRTGRFSRRCPRRHRGARRAARRSAGRPDGRSRGGGRRREESAQYQSRRALRLTFPAARWAPRAWPDCRRCCARSTHPPSIEQMLRDLDHPPRRARPVRFGTRHPRRNACTDAAGDAPTPPAAIAHAPPALRIEGT